MLLTSVGYSLYICPFLQVKEIERHFRLTEIPALAEIRVTTIDSFQVGQIHDLNVSQASEMPLESVCMNLGYFFFFQRN